MPTHYNIQFMATHPVPMTFMPPTNAAIMDAIAAALEDQGLTPITSASERSDNANVFSEYEGRAWVANAPDDLILSVAKLLDGFLAQATDVDSDSWSSRIASLLGDGVGPSSADVAKAFIEHRRKAS